MKCLAANDEPTAEHFMIATSSTNWRPAEMVLRIRVAQSGKRPSLVSARRDWIRLGDPKHCEEGINCSVFQE